MQYELLKTLFKYVVSDKPDPKPVETPKGRSITLKVLEVYFPQGDKAMIPHIDVLESKYGKKGIVNVLGQHLYGEIGILKCLQEDGWIGAWVANFGGLRFWDDMPKAMHQNLVGDVEFSNLIEPLRSKYKMIQEPRGRKKGGFFDIFAWLDNDHFIFLEYKGPGDRPNENEPSFIDAAIDAGVPPEQLIRVKHVGQRMENRQLVA
jgi:hypothetical protein